MSKGFDVRLTQRQTEALIYLCCAFSHMVKQSPAIAAIYGVDSVKMQTIEGAKKRLEKKPIISQSNFKKDDSKKDSQGNG